MPIFADRRTAGRALAAQLHAYADRSDVLVLALPRGGVPVAWEVARALDAPLDVLVVRKLSVPGQPEVAMGAIASSDVCVFDQALIRQLRIGGDVVMRILESERDELHRRERVYLGGRLRRVLAGCTIIRVDDGLATSATMRAAIASLEQQGVAAVVVAIPVASAAVVRELTAAGYTVVAVATPEPFMGVGRWYEDFEQTSDEDVLALLTDSRSRAHAAMPYE